MPGFESPQDVRRQRAASAARAAAVSAGRAFTARPGVSRLGALDNAFAHVTSGKSVNTPFGTDAVNVRGIQQMLKNMGYDITVDGKFGSQTMAALDNVAAHGGKLTPAENTLVNGTDGAKANPVHTALGIQDWNQRFGNSAAKVFPKVTNSNISQIANGNPQAAVTDPQSVNLGPLQTALSAATGKAIPSSLANFGTMIDPSTAADYATEQYGPQVAAAQFLVNRDPLQAAQNQKDIGAWYSQVMNALASATGRDQAASTAGVSSISNAAQALAASLGGSANMGTPEVAAAGQNGVNTLSAMGAAQSQFNNDMAPILAAAQAQSAGNQKNMDAVQAQQDRATLAALQSQEGAAQATAGNQITQENNALSQARNSTALGILQYNNGLGQQTLQNLLGIDSLQGQLALDGVKTNYDNALTTQALARANSYGTKSASQLNDINKQVINELASRGLIKSNGSGGFVLANGASPAAVSVAARGIAAPYFSGGVPNTFLQSVLGGIPNG